ncbi:MAG: hypothetical protein O3A63_15130 [Proteobacteria bacterium]|nr:hypothetical protein [Pseudomonadota bacterium]
MRFRLLQGLGLVLIPALHIVTADVEGPLWFNTLKDLLHVPAYAVLVVLLGRMVQCETWKSISVVALVCLFCAVLIEWTQTGPDGSLNRIDLYTSTTGSACGAVFLLGRTGPFRLTLCAITLLIASPLALDTGWTYYRSGLKLPELIPHPSLFGQGLIRMHGLIEFSDQHLTVVFEDRNRSSPVPD